jgi:Leucine-rich repeat (LRR) protein
MEDAASSGVHGVSSGGYEAESATAVHAASRRSVCRPHQVAELFRRATLRQYRPILAELLQRIEVVYLLNGGARASWCGLGLAELESGWCPPSFEAVTILDLSRNKLANLPTAVLRTLPNLRVLDLSHNALVHLPTDRLWKADCWPQMTVLRLNNNQLAELPGYVANLTALEELDASRNHIRALPDVWRVPALRELTLSNNLLSAVPDDIFMLPALVVLRLADNQLTTLPPTEKWHCRRLRHLDLGDNPLRGDGGLAGLPRVCQHLRQLLLQNTKLVGLGKAEEGV